MTDPARGLFAFRLFGILASGYFLSYGLRAINATIAPELIAELGLSNAALGGLTSAYFVGFSLMQLPLGVWLDRFGPRRVNATLMALAGVACATMALANDLATLWAARVLLGIGFAAGLMAPFAMFRLWFEPAYQTRFAAWILMVGTLGVMIATVPVRLAMPVLGWRGIFLASAGLLACVSLAMWFGLPSAREPAGGRSQSFLKSLLGYREVMNSSFFWRMVIVSSVMQGGFISLQTLWLGPWFTQVIGATPVEAANWLLLFNLVLLLSYLLNGYIAPRIGTSERSTVRLTAIAVAVNFVVLALIAALPAIFGRWGWLVVASVTTVLTPVQARVSLTFPAHLAGRALTGYNLIVFLSVIGVQFLMGYLIDRLIEAGQGPVDAFRLSLGSLAALQGFVWLVFLFWPDRAVPPTTGARSTAG